MSNENLPPNCPMKKSGYEHYCPSPGTGPLTYSETGQCFKHNECSKIVDDFKKMNVPKSSSVLK